jgi:hypothetical protein
MRPRGSYGEVTCALVRAASEGPGTVRELAARAQVGFAVAERKASVLVDRGDLVVLDGGCRPRVLAAPGAAPPPPADRSVPLQAAMRSFWETPAD